jgi:Pectate lyase superfamily protein
MKYRSIYLTLLISALLSVPALAQTINVTAPPYNAIPNDGYDDRNAIQSAVNANPGKDIYFPPGTYNFSGSIDLPHNSTYRLYGDGPGVSTIVFTNGAPYGKAGIAGVNMGASRLTVEGLTLTADSFDSGTAIYALFSAPEGYLTATIRNVQIRGASVTGGHGGYWWAGIYLHRAHNAVVDRVEINGNNSTFDPSIPPDGADRPEWRTEYGIIWNSPSNIKTRKARMSNLEIHYCDSAILTDGWVEDLEVGNFEVVLSGKFDRPAIDLKTSNVANVANFRLIGGHVNALQHGIRLTQVKSATVMQVLLLKHGSGGFGKNGDYLAVSNSTDINLFDNSFDGPAGDIYHVDGIRLHNYTNNVRVKRNYFHTVRPWGLGSCIVVHAYAHSIQIHDNLVDDVNNAYWAYDGTVSNIEHIGNNF